MLLLNYPIIVCDMVMSCTHMCMSSNKVLSALICVNSSKVPVSSHIKLNKLVKAVLIIFDLDYFSRKS